MIETLDLQQRKQLTVPFPEFSSPYQRLWGFGTDSRTWDKQKADQEDQYSWDDQRQDDKQSSRDLRRDVWVRDAQID